MMSFEAVPELLQVDGFWLLMAFDISIPPIYVGGLGVAHPVGTPQGTDGGCARQGGVLTIDNRRWWGEENGPAWRCSKAAAELWWPGRASMSPVAGGGDGGGQVQSKRGG
jgi:hypothetical protein